MAAEAVGCSIVSAVASKVAELLFDPIKQEISYVFKYQSKVDQLKNLVQQLEHKRERVVQLVDTSKRQGDEIFKDVTDWLSRVDKFTREVVEPIIEGENEAKKDCFKGLCPNFFRRYSLSKKAVKTVKDATDLLLKGNFSSVSYRPRPERREFKYAERDYQRFESREKVFLEVMEALEDSKVNMIGVHGMGGVGKTTLANLVAKKVMEDKTIFNEVVKVDVTRDPDLQAIQQKIASDLGLKFDQNNIADQLCHRLQQEKSVLVILDNIWAKLDLSAIGIPLGDDEKERKDEQRRCTVLLTSRDRDVLSNDMSCQKTFFIKVLDHKEAMNLFWNIAGDHSTLPSNFQAVAEEIVGKCGGLPVAIKTIGSTLKNKEFPVWRDALTYLRNSTAREIPEMDSGVYSLIEWSYNFLRKEEEKSLFLLCSLLNGGGQITISDLMRYGMGLGMFGGVKDLEEARDRVHTLIGRLKGSCLLLDGDTENDVKMHDIMHDVAISIATKKHMLNIRNVDASTTGLEDAIQEDTNVISLPYGDIRELPERLKCPKLKFFLLSAEYKNSLQFPDRFFEGMEELRVLHLSNIPFSSLPSSLGCLTNLQTLSLINCYNLTDVAIVGDHLKKLDILSLRSSGIELLPVQIGQLTQLRLLDLGNCKRLVVIPPKVISNLSRLEELYLDNSFTRWEKSEGGSNSNLAELKVLSKLTSLAIHIPDATVMPPNLFSVGLERFKIIIGQWDRRRDWGSGWGFNEKITFPTLKNLELYSLNIEQIWSATMSISSCQNLTKLKVKNCSGLKFLFSYSMANSFVQLQKLVIEKCMSIECVIDTTGFGNEERMIKAMDLPKLNYLELSYLPMLKRFISVNSSEENNIPYTDTDTPLFDEKVGFPSLETLTISTMSKLKKIWHDQLASGSFSKLKNLYIYDCEKLMNIFPSNIIVERRFERLESLCVDTCDSMEVIIEEETSSKCTVDEKLRSASRRFQVFPQLTSLDLEWLSKLKSIYQGIHILEWTALQDLRVHRCDKVEILFGSSKLLNRETNSQQPVFFIDHSKVVFPNLKNLNIRYCHGLRNLTTFSTVESLVKLARMEIESCDMIEEIIQQIGEVNEESPIVFSQLVYLKLHNLPRFEHFCVGNCTLEFPYLKQVVVSGCPNMKIFSKGDSPTPNLQKMQVTNKYQENEERWEGSLNSTIQKMFEEMAGLRGLDELQLSRVPCVKEIWHDQTLPVSVFSNLTTLIVDDCTLMSIAIPANLIQFLNRLWRLEVTNCDSVEEVFQLEELNADQQMFPKLQYLELINLPKLKRFCNFNGIMFHKLHSLTIENCPDMKAFISNSTQVDITANMESQEMISEKNFMPNDIQPFFDDEKVGFPSLETLTISQMSELKRIWNPHQLASGSFSKLKNLEIINCAKLMNIFPSNIIVERRFERLEILCVDMCDSMEVIIEEETSSKCTVDEELPSTSSRFQVFPKLTSLDLQSLPKLKSIYQGIHILEWTALEDLTVGRCDKVEILFGFSELLSCESQQSVFLIDHFKVAFPNLKNLNIEDCKGLRNLTTFSTVESIVKLARMKIQYCNMIEEIIQQIGEVNEESPIVFSQLIYLELRNLLRFEQFCAGNFTLEFPYLGQAVVSGCPSMKIFSEGDLLTPNLQKIQLTKKYKKENEERWEGNLNSTIQKMFEEMVFIYYIFTKISLK